MLIAKEHAAKILQLEEEKIVCYKILNNETHIRKNTKPLKILDYFLNRASRALTSGLSICPLKSKLLHLCKELSEQHQITN